MVEAKRKPFEVHRLSDLGLRDTERSLGSRLTVTSLTKPSNDRAGRCIDAGDPRASGRELARRLLAGSPTPA
jgi:electron transfer flavoprotein alpha/beta subunit